MGKLEENQEKVPLRQQKDHKTGKIEETPAATARYRTMLRRRSNDVADRGPGCRELAAVQGLQPIWTPSSDVIVKVIWSLD